jgi:hypothetical protein
MEVTTILIRLVSDSRNNPTGVDKLICIDGLPPEWLFDRRVVQDNEGEETMDFLKSPWELDITDNIPEGIRFKFQPEPFEVWFETPMEMRPGVTITTNEIPFLKWKKKGYGIRLNVTTNAGEQMWAQVMDLLDRETPRTQRVPQAAIVGDRSYWRLTSEQVPHVKLTGSEIEMPKEQVEKILEKPISRPDQYACRECGDIFGKERGRWMHERRAHKVKEPFVREKVAI